MIKIYSFSEYVYFIVGKTMHQFNELEPSDKNLLILKHKEYVKRVNDLNNIKPDGQMSLEYIDAEADFNKYGHWILTVGDLYKALRPHKEDTLIKLSFRGVTTMGNEVDVNMHLSNIGNSKTKEGGEWKNLIYLNGVVY